MAFKAALPEHSQYSLSEWLHYEGDARPPPRALFCSVPPPNARSARCPDCLLLGLFGETFLFAYRLFSFSFAFAISPRFYIMLFLVSLSLCVYSSVYLI